MLKGYKSRPWQDGEEHFYVPSTRNFSLLLNYDLPTITIPGTLAFFTLLAGVIVIANGVLTVGLPLVIAALLTAMLLLLGYRGSRYISSSEYRKWIRLEKAYAGMSRENQKRHKSTLIKAFHDEKVYDIALPLFTEYGVETDITGLKAELSQVKEEKEIMRKLMRGASNGSL